MSGKPKMVTLKKTEILERNKNIDPKLGPVDNFFVLCDSPFQQAPSKAQEAKRAGFTMNDDRTVLTDAMWARIAPLISGKKGDRGVTAGDNRLFIEGVLWRVRTGCPWRDLPARFGKWNSVFQRFRRLAKRGVFKRVFNALSDDPDFEYVFVDGTIVQAHQKASGAKGGPRNRALAVPAGV